MITGALKNKNRQPVGNILDGRTDQPVGCD